MILRKFLTIFSLILCLNGEEIREILKRPINALKNSGDHVKCVNIESKSTSELLNFNENNLREHVESMECTLMNLNSPEDTYAALNILVMNSGNARVKSIKFHMSNVSSFDIGTFDIETLTYLQNLTAIDVGLRTLEPLFMLNIVKMTLINISRNQITRISCGTFNKMRIESLDLSENRIDHIDMFAFHNTQLDNLDLSGNRLTRLDFLSGLHRVNSLDLSGNLLDRVAVKLKTKLPIQRVSINANSHLTAFSCTSKSEIFELHLTNNGRLSSVKLNNCNVIRMLNVSGSSAPLHVHLNEQLETFIAKSTNLSYLKLPPNSTSSLKKLILSNAKLSRRTIENIMQIESLVKLDLSYNFMGSLEDPVSAIAKLKHLSKLNVKSTNITSFELSKLRDYFKSLGTLEADDDDDDDDGNQE